MGKIGPIEIPRKRGRIEKREQKKSPKWGIGPSKKPLMFLKSETVLNLLQGEKKIRNFDLKTLVVT